MDILYKISDSCFKAESVEELKSKVEQFYATAGTKTEVCIDGDTVRVHIDDAEAAKVDREFEKITNLCAQRKFSAAKPLLDSFIKAHPRYSEAYRISAQMEMENGKIDDAVDICIDAIRCNPRNPWGLLLMGNLFSKHKDNIEVAQNYYDKLLEYCPDNYIALNNVAGIMMERENYDDAMAVFQRIVDGGHKYANSYYGLAVCYYKKNKFKTSFEIALEGSRECSEVAENPEIFRELHKLLLADAQAIVESTNYMNIVLGIKDIVEEKSGMEIRIEKHPELKTYAMLQYGPTHHRNYHLIMYNDQRPFTEHLIVHELMHLDMMLEARKAGTNHVVYSNSENEAAFRGRYAKWTKKMTDRFGHTKAQEITSSVMNGLMLQGMNCPLDLFVEERMFKKYKAMRPIQLLSLMAQEQDNINAIKGSMDSKFIPQSIIDASKIMNMVTSMGLENLYGIRLVGEYKPTKMEFAKAKDMLDEYKAYDDYKPGEEYELVTYFAEEVDIDKFFSLMNEKDFGRDSYEREEATHALKHMALGDDADSSEGNSFDGLSEEQQKRQDTFYKENKDGEDPAKTMMMSMYMLGALEAFDGMSTSMIGDIAFEIAMIGTKGISPDQKSGYHVSAFPNKDFGGYQLLAYYYVSWALAFPEKLAALGLPFDSAWQTAKMMWDAKKGKS